jgi:hypothetical protein
MRKPKKAQVKLPAEVAFDYIKSNQFRVIAADGAFGGLSPNGREIRMALFNERRPIPRKTVHPVTADGTLGAEDLNRRETRQAFVREIEVDVVLDLETAAILHTWLGDKIQQASAARNAAAQKPADDEQKRSQAAKHRKNGSQARH